MSLREALGRLQSPVCIVALSDDQLAVTLSGSGVDPDAGAAVTYAWTPPQTRRAVSTALTDCAPAGAGSRGAVLAASG